MEVIDITTPSWLRGGPRPLHIALAVILGSVAGATAGWNLTFALIVTLALLHHGPIVVTLAAAAIASAAAHVGANFTTAVGSFCCEKVGLGALIESLGHGPVISMLGWHDYELLGSSLLAIVLSLPAAHALARRRNSNGDDDVETVAAPLFRPWGVTVSTVWLMAAAAMMHVAAPQRIGHSLLEQISAAAGAPVTADQIHYDLFGGRLQLDGVRIRDLDEPGRVALRIDTVTAELEPGLLLRGRLHADHIDFEGLTYDADPRSSAPPKLFQNDPTTTALGNSTDGEVRSLDPTQPIEATKFVRNWNERTARLSALGRFITAVESTADLEIGHAVAAQRLHSARRPGLEPRDAISGRTLPLVQIKKLHIGNLPPAWSLGEAAQAELVNLTSRPSTTPRGAQLTLDAPACRTQLTIDFHLSSNDRRHDVVLNCDACSAADLIDVRHAALVGIEAAPNPTLALRGRGTAGRDRLELALACDVVGFRPMLTAARFGNLDAAVWRAGIDRLGGLRLDANVAGRWGSPRVEVTPVAIVDQLKHQLRSVGEHNLVKAVEAGRITPPSAPVAANVPAMSPVAPAIVNPYAPASTAAPAIPFTPAPMPMVPAMAPVAASTPAPTATTTAAPVSVPAPAVATIPTPAMAPAPTMTSAPTMAPAPATAVATTPAVATAPVALPVTSASVARTEPAVEKKPEAKASETVKSAIAAAMEVAATSIKAAPSPLSSAPKNTTEVEPIATAPKAAATVPTTPATSAPSAVSVPKPAAPIAALPPAPSPIAPLPSSVAAASTPIAPSVDNPSKPSEVTPASAIAELRQPASVLDPSWQPGRPTAPTDRANDPFAAAVARTRPTPMQATLATKPTTTPSTARPNGPTVTTPKSNVTAPSGGGAVVISDDAAPRNNAASRDSLVNQWFDSDKPADRPAPPKTADAPAARSSLPEAQPAPQTAAKPWFPRVRKFFGEEEPEIEVAPPEEAFAQNAPPATEGNGSQRPATPGQQPSAPLPDVQTAKTPWYGKLFR